MSYLTDGHACTKSSYFSFECRFLSRLCRRYCTVISTSRYRVEIEFWVIPEMARLYDRLLGPQPAMNAEVREARVALRLIAEVYTTKQPHPTKI
jgi:hypothetical protein